MIQLVKGHANDQTVYAQTMLEAARNRSATVLNTNQALALQDMFLNDF